MNEDLEAVTTPIRIQRRRVKGWRLAPNTVYVGRPTKWGNRHDWREFRENAPRDILWSAEEVNLWARRMAADAYREDLEDELAGPNAEAVRAGLDALRGKNLACWCSTTDGKPCHADVLLEIANR